MKYVMAGSVAAVVVNMLLVPEAMGAELGYSSATPVADVIEVDGVKGFTTYQLRLLLGPEAKSC